jgi:autotransporter-associated beta strand protein
MQRIESGRNQSDKSYITTRQRVLGSAAMAVVLLACGSTQAATYTYNQTVSNTVGTPDLWNAGTAWGGGAAPSSATDTVLDFGGAATLVQDPADTIFNSNDIAGVFQLQQLKVTYRSPGNNNQTSPIPTLDIAGNALEFTSGGALTTSATNNVGSRTGWRTITTVNNELRLSGDMTFDAASSQAKVLGALTFLNNDVARTITLTGAHNGFRSTSTNDNVRPTSSSVSTISGNITNTGAGVTTVTKTGNGLWHLSGTNTFTGGTSVSAGTLFFAGASSVGTGDITVTGTGEVVLGGGTVNNNVSLSGNGPSTSPGGVGQLPGALVLLNDADLAGTVTLTGNTRVSSTLIMTGAVQSGTISGKITGDYQLEVSAGGAQNAGTVTLTNPNNDYSGGTRISGGGTSSSSSAMLRLGADNVIPNGVGKGNVTISQGNYSGSQILRLNGFSETINGLSSSGAQLGVIVENNSAATDSTLTLGDADADAYYRGIIRNGSSKAINITKIGAGTQTLGRGNSYTGVTRVEAGVLEIDFGGYAGSTSTTLSDYLSPTSSLQLAGGTLRLQGRPDGSDISQSVTVATANPRTITFTDVTGISAGQEVTVSDATAGGTQRIMWLDGNVAHLAGTVTVAAGSRTVTAPAKAFTHTQALASVDLSADSTIDFGSDTSMILTFNAITQSVENTVLTIDSWNGNASEGGGLNQLRFAGTYDSSLFPLSQTEVFFTGHGLGYTVQQETGYFEITPVPEPTVIGLLAVAGLGLMRRRRA